MRTSRGEHTTRGTWVRLGLLLALAVLVLVEPRVVGTGAVLTDTTQVSGVVSTSEDFAPSGS